jgi:hypothetical protein
VILKRISHCRGHKRKFGTRRKRHPAQLRSPLTRVFDFKLELFDYLFICLFLTEVRMYLFFKTSRLAIRHSAPPMQFAEGGGADSRV